MTDREKEQFEELHRRRNLLSYSEIIVYAWLKKIIQNEESRNLQLKEIEGRQKILLLEDKRENNLRS